MTVAKVQLMFIYKKKMKKNAVLKKIHHGTFLFKLH